MLFFFLFIILIISEILLQSINFKFFITRDFGNKQKNQIRMQKIKKEEEGGGEEEGREYKFLL